VKAHERGRLGEELAARHLERAGWRILDRNYRAGHLEIDLVACRDGILSFVEVKARGGVGFGHPLLAIDGRKRRDLARAARAWLREHPGRGGEVRFDAVAVLWTPDGRVHLEHVEDAWRLG